MKTLLIISLLMVSLCVRSQQIPFSTIYVENPFIFNPAVAGSDNCFKLRLTSRIQWLGFGDGPFTNILSGYGPHAIRNMGYGGSLTMDKTGPVSMFKLNGGYAYNIFITSEVRASLGLNLGVIQYTVNTSSLKFPSQYDPNHHSGNGGGNSLFTLAPVFTENISRTLPDAGAGVYIYHFDWYLGLSAQQLFPNNLKLLDSNSKDNNNIKAHFYGYGGYRFTMINNIVIEPTALFRVVPSLPVQTDICAKVVYNQQIWGGLSARNSFGDLGSFNDFSIIFGYIHERSVYVSIAYDIIFGDMRRTPSYKPIGTIELVIGYNFADLKKGR